MPTVGELVTAPFKAIGSSVSSAWRSFWDREAALNADPAVSSLRNALAGVPDNYGTPAQAIQNLDNALKDKLLAPTSSGTSGHSASAVAADPSHGYANADLAKQYGMSAETAYQEALSNTSYQRAVKDLQAAGLNPALAMGKVTGADSFAAASGGGGGSSSGAASRVSAQSSALSMALNGLGVLCSAASIYTAIKHPVSYASSEMLGAGGKLLSSSTSARDNTASLIGSINSMSRSLTGMARSIK